MQYIQASTHSNHNYPVKPVVELCGILMTKGMFIIIDHDSPMKAKFLVYQDVCAPITIHFMSQVIPLPNGLTANQLAELPIWEVLRRKRVPFTKIKKEWLKLPSEKLAPADDSEEAQ